MEQTFLFWSPSIAADGIAIYTRDSFPQWNGHNFV
jgi:glucose/arabinose dehydrogenase